ncbi:MAG: DUF5615 family PIN-like protein [Candidatus Levybacteria bacterium]|nr:DUF5615 family PIN-like protein [Candidatus Levybacteria bacterium]
MDSAFAVTTQFPKLRKKANIAHCVHDYGLSIQAEDKEIYQTAVKENRFVLTVNFKDFKPMVGGGKPEVIGIPSQLTNQQIDETVCTFISDINPNDFVGKAIKL